jgi:hypothetical protein
MTPPNQKILGMQQRDSMMLEKQYRVLEIGHLNAVLCLLSTTMLLNGY